MQTIQEHPCGEAVRHAAPSPEQLHAALHGRFPRARARYVAAVLAPAELSVIADLADALILARIKRMPPERLERLDQLVPATRQAWKLYRTLQIHWLRDEEYLLATRLGRPPTHGELSTDFMQHQNGIRFRAYFAMKYPDQVVPAGAQAPNHKQQSTSKSEIRSTKS